MLETYAAEQGMETVKDLINLTYSMKGLSLITDFSDGREVGRRLYMDEHLGISEEESRRMDFEAYGKRNAALYSRQKKHFIFDSINTITAHSFR